VASRPSILDYARNSRRAQLALPTNPSCRRRFRRRQPIRRALYTFCLAGIFCGPLAGAAVAAWEVGTRGDALLVTAVLAVVASICIAVAASLPIDENDVEP
jgi:hypothetical protein